MKVHIEGMGLTGSMLARLLWRNEVDFTWHDSRDPRVAWQASTGAIYPSGSEKFGPDEACREVWAQWHEQDLFEGATEEARFVYCTKAPPHGGKYAREQLESGLWLAGPSAFHLNAQKLVPATRELFAEGEVQAAFAPKMDDVDWYIQAHGWGKRLGHVYWGWTRLVTLDYDRSLYQRDGQEMRPAFYFREGRFIMAYAYPVPDTPYWYAGSSIIKQPVMGRKSLSMEDKYERWKANFERLGMGSVKVAQEGEFIEGWRPAAKADDEAWTRVRGNAITVRPLWNSGIRHFPKQWAGIAQTLGLQP
jgi:hypothetical protein